MFRNGLKFLVSINPRSGYTSAAKKFVPADLEVDVGNRSFMVTGANSGIGKVTALELARRGKLIKHPP